MHMTESDLRHLGDIDAPMGDEDRIQAATHIRECHRVIAELVRVNEAAAPETEWAAPLQAARRLANLGG